MPQKVRQFLLVSFCALAVAPLTHGQTARLAPELEQVRAAMEKYQDPIRAVHDGYFSTVGCVQMPTGGMGIHFLNPQFIGPEPDPLRPQILLYEPDGGRLRLVGVEWFIPLATGIKARPQIFGQPFDGPMEGHHPLIPTELHHYDLHVWLFKDNPAGLFKSTNPNLKCPAGAYTFHEQPAKIVPHPGASIP
ncbi:MAG: hypothetical protein HY651_11355 [Acidobacteria bacterium]|nr:hypothetical protein [Acidobacteriota bacterium]